MSGCSSHGLRHSPHNLESWSSRRIRVDAFVLKSVGHVVACRSRFGEKFNRDSGGETGHDTASCKDEGYDTSKSESDHTVDSVLERIIEGKGNATRGE